MRAILFFILALTATARAVTPDAFQAELAKRLDRVQEFAFLRAEAKRLGVRVYLFGGTAAGFAHYVKWDMLREGGDARFNPQRFDYDYTNIYRANQDLDIVLDGPESKAAELERVLAERYPHLQGEKSAWEIRLLREARGEKEAILDNPDFQLQHTDSHSTGLIEVSDPQGGDPIVRDVRSWSEKEPPFLRDVLDGKLTYYLSDKHDETKRFKEGKNPQIISVVRYLTKAFQYELKLRDEDVEAARKVIDAFDITGLPKDGYVHQWLDKNAKKLIQNAVNIEYAVEMMDKLGLRRKLAAGGGENVAGSLPWWMMKEPLTTKPFGTGGKTAKDLGLDVVSHETDGYSAYESITRAHTGEPNALISRQNVAGEAAMYGPGFYTRRGRVGARGTGLTIRFKLHPDAREDVDFKIVTGDYVLILNKAALEIVPESLSLSVPEYFALLASDRGLDHSDRGILERLQRRVRAKMNTITDDEYREIAKTVREAVAAKRGSSLVVQEWFALPGHRPFSKAIVDEMISSGQHDAFLAASVFSQDFWKQHNRAQEVAARGARIKEIVDGMVGGGVSIRSLAKDRPGRLDEALYALSMAANEPQCIALIENAFSNPRFHNSRAALLAMIGRLMNDDNYKLKAAIAKMLGRPHARGWSDALTAFIAVGSEDALIRLVKDIFAKGTPAADEARMMQLVSRLSNDGSPNLKRAIAKHVFDKPHARAWSGALHQFIGIADETSLIELAKRVFTLNTPAANEAAVIAILNRLKNGTNPELQKALVRSVFTSRHGRGWNAALVQLVDLGDEPTLHEVIAKVLAPGLVTTADAIERLLGRLTAGSNPKLVTAIGKLVFPTRHAGAWTPALRTFIQLADEPQLAALLRSVFVPGGPLATEDNLLAILGRLNPGSNVKLEALVRDAVLIRPHTFDWQRARARIGELTGVVPPTSPAPGITAACLGALRRLFGG